MVIEGYRSAEEAVLVAEAERQSDLQSRQKLAELIDEDNPLSAQARAELEALNAKGDLFAALPAHLRPVESAEDRELQELLAVDYSPTERPRQRAYEDPAARRKRPLFERHAPVERKGSAPSNDDRE